MFLVEGKKKTKSRGRAKNIFTAIYIYIHAYGQDTRMILEWCVRMKDVYFKDL